ncbi:urease accessory protein UreE [Devosia submarina]|uniref:urease accessory protein UreE n=1 Tax=Devosia submarina TaxID=1173082 RepID=UPI000D35ED54|nr:urease accessory protein UreE [Devosia submarina]
MLTVSAHLPAAEVAQEFFATVTLEAGERRLRRRSLRLSTGEDILLDFPATITLDDGDGLELSDGRLVGIKAAREPLYEVTGKNQAHLVRLAWHIGNRHLPAQLEGERLLIRRDHVIREMLVGLGARVCDVEAPFSPEHGAYHGHSHGTENHALRLQR